MQEKMESDGAGIEKDTGSVESLKGAPPRPRSRQARDGLWGEGGNEKDTGLLGAEADADSPLSGRSFAQTFPGIELHGP